MKKLDWYLIRKFLGTFVYSVFLIILIVIVFDVSENIGHFVSREAPLNAIIFDYYVNFIPFFVNMFSALFTFIAVVFFTSRMAANSEIVAILSSGISLKRLLIPYLLCAILIGLVNVYLSNVTIPKVNEPRIAFEQEFTKRPFFNRDRNIHLQYDSVTFYYVENFDVHNNTGYRFTIETISPENGLLKKISAESAWFDTAKNTWSLNNYHVRVLDSLGETIKHGFQKNLELTLRPEDFSYNRYGVSTMTYREIKAFVEREQLRGASRSRIKEYKYDSMVRFSHPFAALVLTLLAVSISSRKTRGGTGFHLAIGLGIAFTFIVFLQFSRVFATFGNFPVWLAAWLPIIVFGLIAVALLRLAPR